MRKVFILFLVSILLCPTFAYAEGGRRMANNREDTTLELRQRQSGSGSRNDIYVPPGTPGSGQYNGIITGGSMGPIYNRNASSLSSSGSLSDLFAAQLKAQLEALEKQRNNALSNLSNQKSALKENYYGKRNQAAAQSDVGAYNFAQKAASLGIAGSAAMLPEIYKNNALQGNIGALNQQEAAGNAEIDSNISNVNNAYESDVAAAKASIEAAQLQAELQQQQADQVAALEQQRYDAEQAQKADTLAYNKLQDTKADYANTIGQYSADYQAQINKVLNDGDPSNDWQASYLGAARAKKIQDQQEQQAAAQIATQKAQQQQFENDYKLKQLDLDTKRTNYTINRPYSSGGGNRLTANQQLNQTNNAKVSQMANWIYNVPTKVEAMQRLTQNKAMILQQLMEAGYDGSSALKYWNDMYADLGGL